MLNKNEQLLLLELMKKKEIFRKDQNIVKSKKFYGFMKKLEEKELIVSDILIKNNLRIKFYRLTPFGELIAFCLSKLPSTPKKYQNNKTLIRWFYE